VSFSDDTLTVGLGDGRTVSVPTRWFPRLFNATPQERNDWELIGGGIGIHWEAIEEDVSVASLLRPEKFMRMADPALPPQQFRSRSRLIAVASPRKKRSRRGG